MVGPVSVVDELLRVWPILAAVGAVLWGAVMFGQNLRNRVSRLGHRVEAVAQEHAAHEDLCSERYAAIERQHVERTKLIDERHKENRERFDRLESKLDRLLDLR
jgi:hypothetical protein